MLQQAIVMPQNGKRELHDTQGTRDERGIAIDYVGVKNVKFPIQLKMWDGSQQSTIGTFAIYVSLPADQRGTHMSRFMEMLHESDRIVDPRDILSFCESIKKRLEAPRAKIELECPYFLEKAAPVTGVRSLLDYRLKVMGILSEDAEDKCMSIVVPAKSLCPCSKLISDYGAHNQRSIISASIRTQQPVWPEEMIETIEASASSPIYSLLKRPDERHVTQAAYDNPKFVEDIVRDLALRLNNDDRVIWYSISSENQESIHNHEAYATIERAKV